MPKAHFNIHGVPLEISADHPLILETFAGDLRWFRTQGGPSPRGAIRLKLTALPVSENSDGHPPELFTPYREMSSEQTLATGKTVTCYGKSALAVISSVRKPLIHAAMSPEMALLIDPAYHYCFTQPANLWFKRRGLFFLHAGCVADRSRGVLLIGHSRSGKSTLTVSAVRAGFQFLSDEQPLLSLRDSRVTAHCFPRRIRLDQKSAGRFQELKTLAGSADKRMVFPIETIRPHSIQSSCRLSLLVFPRFKKHGKIKVQKLAPTTAMGKLLEDDHFIWYRNKPLNQISQRHLNLFKQLVDQAPAYALDYTDREIPAVPALLRKLLGKNP